MTLNIFAKDAKNFRQNNLVSGLAQSNHLNYNHIFFKMKSGFENFEVVDFLTLLRQGPGHQELK